MAKFKYSLFFDFHTPTNINRICDKFDAVKFVGQLKECGIDFLTWHARCNQGGAYYDTQIGLRHPGLNFDLWDELSKQCRKNGIKLSAYFNALLSDEELIRHPEWMVVHPDGRVLSEPPTSPYRRTACYNSPFREHLRDMALEVLERYGVDGFFFDCVQENPCICPRCVEEMRQLNYDPLSPDAVAEFNRMSLLRYCRFLTDAIRAVKPDALLFFNNPAFEDVDSLISHLECECLPTAGWGYDYLPPMAHYLRTIAGPDRTVLNMTGRFFDWGDFGGLRPEPSVEYDMLYGLGNGMRPDISDHFPPNGEFPQPVFEMVRNIYARLRRLDPWLEDAMNVNRTAIVYPGSIRRLRSSRSLKGAVRILDELQIQFDVVTDYVSWESYDLLIFPDDVELTPPMLERLKKHLAKGGRIFATGASGKTPNGFAAAWWPAVPDHGKPFDPVYFMPQGKYAAGLPQMPLSVYADAERCLAAPGSAVEQFLVQPYLNRGWDGERTNYYMAPDKISENVFVAEKNGVVYCAGRIFEGYFKRAPYHLRLLVGNILSALRPDCEFQSHGLPAFARAFVQRSPDGRRRLVHLLAYQPEIRGATNTLETPALLEGIDIAVKLDGMPVTQVYSAPDRIPLDYSVKDDFCTMRIDRLCGYKLIVIE